MSTFRHRKIKAVMTALLVVAIGITTGVTTFPTAEATGKTEVRQESVCTHSYTAGVKGGTHQQCDTYTTAARTYCEYRYTNYVSSWTGFGGCK